MAQPRELKEVPTDEVCADVRRDRAVRGATWRRWTTPERERAYGRVQQWFADHADKITGHSKLMPPDTATTVRLDGGRAADHRRAVHRGQGGRLRVHRDRGRRPGRGAADGEGPGRPARSWRSGRSPACDRREPHAELARVVRDHAGRLAAALVPLLGDFSAAEDLVQDAVEAALRRWPVEGIPDRPDAWLFTVARRRGLDVLRRQQNYREQAGRWCSGRCGREPDDRLRLIFTCCHPALPRAGQIALTLRVVCGLTTAQIAARVPRAGVHRRRSASPAPSGRSPTPASRTGSRDDDELGRAPRRSTGGHLPALQRGLPVQHRRRGPLAATWSTTPSGSPPCCTG